MKTKCCFGTLLICCVMSVMVASGEPPWNSATNSSSFTNSTPLARLNEVVADPNSPIKFNARVKEYQLVYSSATSNSSSTSVIPLEYCPWTGVKLPPSRRDELFVQISPSEQDAISKKLINIRNLNDLERQFGKAQEIYGPNDNRKQQLTYTNIAKTFNLIVEEDLHGQLTYSIWAKQK